jgi:MFS family permease
LNYRLWAAGALVSNVGTWMQRTAQDWLVLTQLTHHSASAVGTVMALQFGPQLLLLPWAGFAADHYNQRKLLIVTQAAMGVLALALGLLTVTGVVQLWHVYVFAFLSGCASAFDGPVRQTFVAELVGDEDLPNGVALNSTSFNAAQMIGPAAAGLVIASIDSGWAFLVNGASFAAVLGSLFLVRVSELHTTARADRTRGGLTEGFRYVRSRPDLKAILVMLFLIGTFGLNFPIFISTMAVSVFHADARGYGLLSSIMAIGTIAGALFAAGRDRPPRFMALLIGAATFSLGCTLGRRCPKLLAVRRCAHGRRRGFLDLHQRNQQPDAALERTRHAGAGHGAAPWHRTRGYADRRADRGLGGRPSGPTLGTRRRRSIGLRGGHGGHLHHDATDSSASVGVGAYTAASRRISQGHFCAGKQARKPFSSK